VYVQREIDDYLTRFFSGSAPRALILAGIVGCGKTTVVQHLLERIAPHRAVFSFTGDEVGFRNTVATDTAFLVNRVRSSTQGPALVFVDEVQKTEAVFDALKICFDAGVSFVVSGSNPAYLATAARRRLQRRADFMTLAPFSLPEILHNQGWIHLEKCQEGLLDILDRNTQLTVPDLGLRLTEEIQTLSLRYLKIGGLPLAHLEVDATLAMRQIRTVVERGFEVIRHDNKNISDAVRTYLARNQSREFSYQSVMQRTGVRRRDDINSEIEELQGHGYLHAKRPTLMGEDRRSYLCVYAYADPGIVSYLSGTEEPLSDDLGHRLEGMVHARLEFLRQLIPLKTELAYYKPFTVDQNNKTKFGPGEIDFVYSRGTRHVPIEVKLTADVAAIDSTLVENFVRRYESPYGIILYGGVPQIRDDRRLIYWPYWAV
jgi:predicted AAA+ superfamily ATPase